MSVNKVSNGRTTKRIGPRPCHPAGNHVAPDGKYFHRGARRLPEDNSRAEADSERSGEFAGQPRRKIATADINNERNHEHLEGEKNRKIGERQRLHADHAGYRTERLQHRASEAGLRPARREKAGQL